MTPRPIVLNQSSRKTYDDCQRLYGWIRVQRLEPPTKRSAPEIGTAVHAGLRIAHGEGGTLEKAQEEANAVITKAAGPSTRFEDKDLEECKDIINRVMPAYFEHYSDIGELWTPLDQEVQFLVEVGEGTGVYLRGRADNLSIHAGGLWLVDYKTAGKMDMRELMKYELDIQLTSYIYGITKQLYLDAMKEGKEPIAVRGAIVDFLVKTQTPQFAREQYTRSEAEIEEFVAEWVEIANRVREQHRRVEAGENWKIVFPKNTNHCFRYGTCAFRDLCLKDTPTRRAAYNVRADDYVDTAQKELDDAWRKENVEC